MITEKEVVEALDHGKKEVIEEYLKTNDVNKIILSTSLFGFHGTLFHYACHLLNLDLMAFLIERKADVNILGGSSTTAPNLDKSRPIHYLLAKEGYIEKKKAGLKLLLDNKADIDGVDYLGRTIFCHKIILWDSSKVTDLCNDLALLLANGANINHRQPDGKTPIYLALDRKAHVYPAFGLEICSFLKEHGEQINMPVNMKGKIYYRAADYALELGRHDCYDLLNVSDISLEKKIESLENQVSKLNTQVSQQEARIKQLETKATTGIAEDKVQSEPTPRPRRFSTLF